MSKDLLVVELKLTVDGTAHAIAPSMIERLDLDVQPWGFRGEVAFWVSSERVADSLFAAFTPRTLTEVELKISEPTDPTTNVLRLTLKGLVTEKEFSEQSARSSAAAMQILYRRYVVRFADNMQVLWKQHFPCDLLGQSTFQALVNAHKGAKIPITIEGLTDATTTYDITCVGLGIPGNEASFYDFFVQYVDAQDGVLTHDPATGNYKLTAIKAAAGAAVSFEPDEVASFEVVFPATPRNAAAVVNSYVTNATKTDIANDQAVTGVRRDFLVRTSIQAQVDARVTLETARLKQPEHLVAVRFTCVPSMKVTPGSLVKFGHEWFKTGLYVKGKDYRVRSLTIKGVSKEVFPRLEKDRDEMAFELDVAATLELKTEKIAPLPPYVRPKWPVPIEGIVVSDQGAAADETYEIKTDSATSTDWYRVKIPLFANKIILVPYNPNTLPGHFYFPVMKGARVLLHFGFRDAWLDRFLEWRPHGRLPLDGQGNHLLVGLSDTSKTSVSHAYVDSKPVLTLTRVKDKDNQLIEIKDGTITLRTKEDA